MARDALQVIQLCLWVFQVLPGCLLCQVNMGQLSASLDLCRAGTLVLRLPSGAGMIVVWLRACLMT